MKKTLLSGLCSSKFLLCLLALSLFATLSRADEFVEDPNDPDGGYWLLDPYEVNGGDDSYDDWDPNYDGSDVSGDYYGDSNYDSNWDWVDDTSGGGGGSGQESLELYVLDPVVVKAQEAKRGFFGWLKDTWNNVKEIVHGALDVVGMIPGVGEVADAINGVLYLLEGDFVNAGASFVGMVPGVGDTIKITIRYGPDAVKTIVKSVDEVSASVKNYASWSSARTSYWKGKGYSDGKGPQRRVLVQNRKTGEFEERIETKELHHKVARKDGGGNEASNLEEVWPSEHEAIDPHRHTGYDLIEVLD